MKTENTSSVALPSALLAEAQAAANEEHRATDELVREAVEGYLKSRREHRSSSGTERKQRPAGRKSLAQLFAESPLKGLDLKFERDPDPGRPVQL